MDPSSFLVIIAVCVVAYLVVDVQRRKANEDKNRMYDLLQAALQSCVELAEAEKAARAALKKLAKSRKNQIKEMGHRLEELELLMQSPDDEDDEEDEDDEQEPPDSNASSDSKIASISLALQNKLRRANAVVNAASKAGEKVDPKLLAPILETNLDSLELYGEDKS